MPVGPRGSQGPAKDVLVRLLPAHQSGDRYLLPLRWEVTRPAGQLFPTLDGNLELAADGELTSRLSIVASYDPPIGPVGGHHRQSHHVQGGQRDHDGAAARSWLSAPPLGPAARLSKA